MKYLKHKMVKKHLIYIKNINPNIVFLDLTMPIMDGFEALEKIKEFDKNAKVVVISADIQKQAMDKVRELGAFNFVKKPIDSSKMKQILKN
jgi:two-component system chemotaxis response regulator CheY